MNYQNKSRRILIRANSTPLHIAILFREDEIVDKLLKEHADVHAMDELGLTPLHLSLIVSRGWVARSLFRKASFDFRDIRTKDGMSYLHVAAFADDEEAVRKLLRDGADVNGIIRDTAPECLADFVGKTPLHLAVRAEEAARVLIENGANIFLKNPNSKYETPLDFAAKQFSSSVIFEKLKRKVKLGPLTESGLTTLHVACSILDLEWARILLKSGANPNAQVKNDKIQANTPMHLVIARATSTESIPDNFRLLVRLLIEYGANVNISNNHETPLHMIASAYFAESTYHQDHEIDRSRKAVLLSMADWLLSNQRSYALNPTDLDGFSHFHFACVTNNCPVIKKYLDSGIDVNHSIRPFAKNREGFTPLHFAILYKNVDVALLLLECGADVRVRDIDDNPVLHFAIQHYVNSQLLDALLSKGVDINAKNVNGQTPILCLLSHRNLVHDQKMDAIQVLLKRGASVRITDSKGNTPLHYAVGLLMNFQLLDALLEKGADINARNVGYQTPIVSLLFRGNVTYEQFRFFVDRGSLISHGVTISKQGIIGYTLEHTKPSDVELVMETLMELINLDRAINEGFLAIHSLVSVYPKSQLTREHYINVIQRLTAKGSDIDEPDEKGKRALDVALSFQNRGAVEALLWLGANVNFIGDKNSKFSLVRKHWYGYDPYEEIRKHFMKKHLWKMALVKLDLNTSFQRAVKNREWEPNENDMQAYLSELKKLESTNICKSLHAKYFLSEWGAVIEYPNMSVAKRHAVNNFFKKDDDLRKEFPEFAGLLMMQYRKALARVKLMQPVKEILVAAGIDLPDLCLEAILKYLKNSELNFLIENPDEICQPVKRRRFQ